MKGKGRLIQIILLMIFINFSRCVNADEFTYDDQGKRDPFWPLINQSGVVVSYDVDFTLTDLILEGIVEGGADGGHHLAIINGRVVKEQDAIGNFRIQEISREAVLLIKDNQRFQLKLKKEELDD